MRLVCCRKGILSYEKHPKQCEISCFGCFFVLDCKAANQLCKVKGSLNYIFSGTILNEGSMISI